MLKWSTIWCNGRSKSYRRIRTLRLNWRKIAGLGVLLLLFTGVTRASENSKTMIDYTIGWERPNTHLFEIKVQAASDGSETIDFALPSWRPGRYVIQNYARNVQEFAALNERGEPLPWDKIDKSTWRVRTAGSKLVVARYKYYANLLDAGSSLLNETEAYFNGTNLFMYIPERRMQPCRLKILAPAGWSIAIPLLLEEQQTYRAANYEELADSPAIASPTLIIDQFKQGTATYYLAYQGKVEFSQDKLATQISRIVAEQVKLFGTVPFDTYWFLFHLAPSARWHGVEHTNSTSCVAPQAALKTEQGRQNFYSLASHEFFHVWNVKRIRPQVFNPPNYSAETYTRLLWFFEGVTSYYGDLMLRRSGVIDERGFFTELEKSINELQNTPGRLIASAEEASFNGWLQPDDRENAQLSFYTKGQLIGLLLDLEIRRRSGQTKSLDDVMRYLDERYGQRGVGVPEDGIRAAVEAVVGGSFQEFFSRFVAGRDELPYNQYLSVAGLQLVEETDKTKPEAYLGIKVSNDERAVITNIQPDSPALLAGLDRGDILLAINDRQVTAANLQDLLSDFNPNERVTVTVFREGRLRQFEVMLRGGGNTVYRIKPVENRTEAQQRVIASWLGSAK
jgi:predicted metalloprotease with PDZ domain